MPAPGNDESKWHHSREELRRCGYPDNFDEHQHLRTVDIVKIFPYVCFSPQGIEEERKARAWCGKMLKGTFSAGDWDNDCIKKFYNLDVPESLKKPFSPTYIYFFTNVSDYILFKLVWGIH